MDKTRYSQGEHITIKLALKNIASRNLRLDFRTNLQADFAVQRENNWIFFKTVQDIWRYSNKIIIKRDHNVLSLAPQETKVYMCEWDQKDYGGTTVEPGKYIITGVFNAIGESAELHMRGKTE